MTGSTISSTSAAITSPPVSIAPPEPRPFRSGPRSPAGRPRHSRQCPRPHCVHRSATPHQVDGAPVRDLALLLRDVAASVLVQLEGQGGHPGSDGGPPCYLDRASGATRGIPATTCRTVSWLTSMPRAASISSTVATKLKCH